MNLRTGIAVFASAFAVLAAVVPADGETSIERRAKEIAPLLSETPDAFGAVIDDRKGWRRVGEAVTFRNVVRDAERLLVQAIPEDDPELYMDYYRTGNRDRYQNFRSARWSRLSRLVLAECIENRGRFIPAIEETIRVLCADKSWVYPAHDSGAGVFKGEQTYIDLGSATSSWEIAIAGRSLGNKLSPETRELIRENLERRTFKPYEEAIRSGNIDRNWWIKTTNNWNAVCHAGVIGAALCSIEDHERRAFFIAAAEENIEFFFKGFTPDGYCSEGMGYWNYGFGYFVFLAESVYQATGGLDPAKKEKSLDWFKHAGVREIALFAPRMEFAPNIYAAFADCSPTAKPSPDTMAFLSRRLGFGMKTWEDRGLQLAGGPGSLHSVAIYRFPNSAIEVPTVDPVEGLNPMNDQVTEFKNAGVVLLRAKNNNPGLLSLAFKSGHNAEHHNHNDVASYTVSRGGGLPILDPGGEIYTSRTFSGKRYDSGVLSSLGHSVPRIDGKLQKLGREASGKISKNGEKWILDIKKAYDVPGLDKLERSIQFTGGGELLEISDSFECERECEFETAVISFGPCKRLESSEVFSFVIEEGDRAVQLTVTASDKSELKFEQIEINENLSSRKKPIRLGFSFPEKRKSGSIEMKIRPYGN